MQKNSAPYQKKVKLFWRQGYLYNRKGNRTGDMYRIERNPEMVREWKGGDIAYEN